MEEHEVVWPMGLRDHDPSLADRPLAFNPKGFLVAILDDDDHAEQARAALQAAGFADRDLRVYQPADPGRPPAVPRPTQPHPAGRGWPHRRHHRPRALP